MPKFEKHNTPLFNACVELLLANGFVRGNKHYFYRKSKPQYNDRIFYLYQYYVDCATLNIYYPQESSKYLKTVEDLHEQLKRFEHEK